MGGNQLGNLTYAYDADGRVISKGGSFAQVNLPAAASGNTFNADNAMTAFNGTSLSYDANGNLTSDGTYTYTWDARNHLTQITQKRTTVATFQYDAFGRRVEKTVNGVTTQYLYDGLNPVEELDGSSPANVTATMLTGLGIDQYFARTDSNGTMSYLTDMLGSTIALANSSGLATQYSYEPFGATTVTGSSTNPFQFTGRENDGTGLYYYRARYYSPTYGRFISQDPLGFPGSGSNLYAYAANNPSGLADPTGLLTPFTLGFDAEAAVAGGVIGGLIGGVVAAQNGCNFWRGFTTGFLFGAVTGLTLDNILLDAALGGGIGVGSAIAQDILCGAPITFSGLWRSAVSGATGGLFGNVAAGAGVEPTFGALIGVVVGNGLTTAPSPVLRSEPTILSAARN